MFVVLIVLVILFDDANKKKKIKIPAGITYSKSTNETGVQQGVKNMEFWLGLYRSFVFLSKRTCAHFVDLKGN